MKRWSQCRGCGCSIADLVALTLSCSPLLVGAAAHADTLPVEVTAADTSSTPAPSVPPPPMPEWTAKGQLGYVESTGNAAAETANAKLDVVQALGLWKNTLHLEGLYAKSGSVVSAERWAGVAQADYALNKPLFVFGALHYTDDKFSGFAYQESIIAGIGDVLLDSAHNKFSVQLGAGYRDMRPELLIDNAAGQVVYREPQATEEGAIATGEIDAEHDFNATTKITEKAVTDSGAGDTSVANDFNVQVQMSRRLALSAGYSVQYNSSPPAGVKKLDTFTTLNLVFQL